ncbi:phage portal protein [uncultured Sulfitobacter sp.]|uniref:phage portal protein n=1 Tax=uncultured Sulfitobacter sp. TaxID=191468 RepID=UPI002595D1C3|nr:phage portal protein [uncultured Sulfitobacter sp.]
MTEPAANLPTVTPAAPGESAMGGALEGASRTSRELASWKPAIISPDQAINAEKPFLDSRARDLTLNDGLIQGAVSVRKDSIIGATYRLNARPDHRVIFGEDSEAGRSWAEAFQIAAESRFNLAAESRDCWFDASGRQTFTGMLRLAVGVFCYTGEGLATSEWKDQSRRPFKTAIQQVSSDRLSNPDGYEDTKTLRRGIRMDRYGEHLGYHIQMGHPSEFYDFRNLKWKYIAARKPWGRKQVLYYNDPIQIDQSRGVSDMVAALEHCKMTKQFSRLRLQKAVVSASYAAAVESELPNPDIVAAMGGGADGYEKSMGLYMEMLGEYLGEAENVKIDGVQIPHFFPGTKLNFQGMGGKEDGSDQYYESLLRHVAATLGISYEALSRDFSQLSYSSQKASMAVEHRSMQAKKTMFADAFATDIYTLWLEEEIAAGNLPLPPGRNRTDFYRPLMKEAYSRCRWIGTGKGQIDELKETQAAIMRIKGGLSTWEIECARLGIDFRELVDQRRAEAALIAAAGLEFDLSPQKQGGNNTMNESGDTDEGTQDNGSQTDE